MSLLLPKLQSLKTSDEIVEALEETIKFKSLDIETFELLEFALQSQLKKDWFEPKLIIAIIKLVQFYPNRDWKYEDIIYGALLKSLSEVPSSCLDVSFFFPSIV